MTAAADPTGGAHEAPHWAAEELEGGIRRLTLHNEPRRNALNPALVEQLAQALAPESSRDVRAWILQSAGPKSFCAGFDLHALTPPAEGDPLPDERLSEVMGLLERHPAPSLALVQGAAFGAGCELACACDFRLGTPEALFCMPPVRLGIVYAPEGLRRVARVVGLHRARRMFLRAERVRSDALLAWGLLDEVLPSEELAPAGERWARELAAGAPLAVAGTKRSLELLAQERWTAEELSSLQADRLAAYQSEDVREGRAAFLEKRTPRFEGR